MLKVQDVPSLLMYLYNVHLHSVPAGDGYEQVPHVSMAVWAVVLHSGVLI